MEVSIKDRFIVLWSVMMCVQVDTKKCEACLKCAGVCPTGSLIKANDGTKDHAKVNEATCIDCYMCVDECDSGALKEP